MYGLLVSLGIALGLLTSEKLAKEHKLIHNINIDEFWKLSFFSLIGALIGARMYHVVHFYEYYINSPMTIFKVWEGGIGIFGALFGAIFTTVLYCKVYKLNPLPFLGLLSVTVSLAQSIGRWGNFFNKELFGIPTTGILKIYIPYNLRPEIYLNNEYFHPIFLYESMGSLIIFYLIYNLYAKKGKFGQAFYTYLGLYGLLRFFIEFLRIDPWEIYGLNVAQCISILLIMIYLASDHGGFALKEKIKQLLEKEGYDYNDKGPLSYNENDDYPDFVTPAMQEMNPQSDKAVLVCRNGVGVSMLANKFKDIRAALSWNAQHAATSRNDDNSNVLALPADYISEERALETVKTWLQTNFSEDKRHIRRLEKFPS